MRRAVTMQQVAERARVSISTVSFILNDTKPVTAETRARVLRAIDELGYQRNETARALAARKTRILALVYPLLEHRDHNPVFTAVAAAAKSQGYRLVLWPIPDGNDAAAEISSLVDTGFVDGVILLEVEFDDPRVERLRAGSTPFVLIGRTRDVSDLDYVDIDFEQTTHDAIRRFADLGHRHISLVVEDMRGTEFADYGAPLRSESAFADATEALGLEGHVIRIPHGVPAEVATADRLLEQAPHTTAVLTFHEAATAGLVNGLRRRGIVVPRDMSIIAHSAFPDFGALIDPPLDTYVMSSDELGRLAAETLISRLAGAGSEPVQTKIACVPRHRSSVAVAPVGRDTH